MQISKEVCTFAFKGYFDCKTTKVACALFLNFDNNFDILFSFTQKTHNQLSALIVRAEAFGLPVADVIASKEYLQYNEYKLCLDQMITQLYEYDIEIDSEFCREVENIAESLAISRNLYKYIEELIRK